MSCYNWERGTIKIPAKEYIKFRNDIVRSWNERQARVLMQAKALHAKLKSKKTFDWSEASQVVRQYCSEPEMCTDLLFKRELFTEWKLRAPLKKNLSTVSTRGSNLHVIQLPEATITFNDTDKTVTWAVHENNRAVERAHTDPTARELFRLLHQIKWTRGSGGQIVGNDEYNCDDYNFGGRANYVTMQFGKHA